MDEVYLRLAADTVADYLYNHVGTFKVAERSLAQASPDGDREQKNGRNEKMDEDTEFLYWNEDTDGAVVTEVPENQSGGMLAGGALAAFIALLLFVAYHNRKK